MAASAILLETALSFLGFGVQPPDVSLGLLIAADLLTARGPVRPRLTAKPLPIRWAVYLAGIFAVLIFGVYGPGFSESQFIYFQF